MTPEVVTFINIFSLDCRDHFLSPVYAAYSDHLINLDLISVTLIIKESRFYACHCIIVAVLLCFLSLTSVCPADEAPSSQKPQYYGKRPSFSHIMGEIMLYIFNIYVSTQETGRCNSVN
jgi:hypothetical protein